MYHALHTQGFLARFYRNDFTLKRCSLKMYHYVIELLLLRYDVSSIKINDVKMTPICFSENLIEFINEYSISFVIIFWLQFNPNRSAWSKTSLYFHLVSTFKLSYIYKYKVLSTVLSFTFAKWPQVYIFNYKNVS